MTVAHSVLHHLPSSLWCFALPPTFSLASPPQAPCGPLAGVSSAQGALFPGICRAGLLLHLPQIFSEDSSEIYPKHPVLQTPSLPMAGLFTLPSHPDFVVVFDNTCCNIKR